MRYLILAVLLFAGTVQAQQVDNTNNSSSDALAASDSAAVNQGVNLNAQFNSATPDQQIFKYKGNIGNTPVALAAAVSFSADYCGGTNSAGLSGAGWTIGGSKVVFDEQCNARRNAETMGKEAVNAFNMGDKGEAWRLHRMSVYAACTANQQMADGCFYMGLIDQRTLEHIKSTVPAKK